MNNKGRDKFSAGSNQSAFDMFKAISKPSNPQPSAHQSDSTGVKSNLLEFGKPTALKGLITVHEIDTNLSRKFELETDARLNLDEVIRYFRKDAAMKAYTVLEMTKKTSSKRLSATNTGLVEAMCGHFLCEKAPAAS